MRSTQSSSTRFSEGLQQKIHLPLVLAASLFCLSQSGCAAITNPTVDAFPARGLPPELLFGRSRDEEVSILLSLLGQPSPTIYRLGPNDVLSVYIEGIFTTKQELLPIH